MFSYPPESGSSDARAAPSHPEGCLWRFALPPLSVLLVSVFLFLGLSQVKIGQAVSHTSIQPADEINQQGIAPLFTPEVQAWEEKILAWSDQYYLDPNLVATVMQIESCGYKKARSGAGAMGLFQVMPYHFQDGEDPYNPGTNARRGLKYLRMSQESGKDTILTLAGYNGGITGAQKPREEWSSETNRYVYWGFQIYQDAKAGLAYSERLTEWLQSGGSYLCQLARENN